MGNKGALVIRFVGDARDLNKTTMKVSKNMSGMSKLGLGLAAGVGAVIAGVGALAVATTKDMIRVETLGKATENVIKATGGAAGRSRSQVDRLAQKLERMSGAEAETVTEGQNMLLTFKNIKGRQFDEATRAALDMGVAMNKGKLEGLDLQSESIRLGKALNDPIKGISALTKVGVSFSEQQKKQIKVMQESGNLAGAQKIILKELKSEFGGAAKAAGQTTEGMFAKIKNTFGNLAESTLSFVLPVLATLMQWVNNKVMPVLVRFGDWLKNDGAAHLKAFGGWIKNNVLPPLRTLGGFIVTTLVPGLISLGKWMMNNRGVVTGLAISVGALVAITKVHAAVMAVQAAGGMLAYVKSLTLVSNATKVATAVQWAFGAATKFALGPIGLVITAITLLVGAFVWFFTKTKVGKKIVQTVWSGIKSAIKGVSDWWTKTAMPAFRMGLNILGMAFRAYLGLLKKIWIDGVWGTLKRVWGWINKNVFQKIRLGILVLRLAFALGKDKIVSSFTSIWTWLNRIGGRIRKSVFGGLRSGLSAVRSWFGAARDNVVGVFNRMKDGLQRVGAWIRKHVFGGIRSALGHMRNAFGNAKDAIGRIWGRLQRAASKPVKFLIQTVWNNGLRKMLNAIPGVDIKPVAVKFAKGGHRGGGAVTGGIAGRDSVPALYKPGEHVWTDREVAAVGGQKVMYGMRKAALAGRLEFAKGGALSADAIARAQAFARQQSGKPYGWGAVGPSAYDCSGFMSALTNVLQGQSPYRRRGATADFPWSGFRKGPGQFTIGSTPNYAGSGIGHMAGNLAGMGVESRGGRGVILGPGAMNPSGIGPLYHLGIGGKMGAGSNWLSTIANVLSTMRKLPGQINEIMSNGSWIGSFLKKLAAGMWSRIADFINKKIPDIGSIKTNPIPRKFAKGGLVRARAGGTQITVGEAGYDEMITPVGGPHGPRGPRPPQRVVHVDLGEPHMKYIREQVRKKYGGNVQMALGST